MLMLPSLYDTVATPPLYSTIQYNGEIQTLDTVRCRAVPQHTWGHATPAACRSRPHPHSKANAEIRDVAFNGIYDS